MAYNKRQRNKTRANTLVEQLGRSIDHCQSIMYDFEIDPEEIRKTLKIYHDTGRLEYQGQYPVQMLPLLATMVSLIYTKQMAERYKTTI